MPALLTSVDVAELSCRFRDDLGSPPVLPHRRNKRIATCRFGSPAQPLDAA
jgi:hypothetical protein